MNNEVYRELEWELITNTHTHRYTHLHISIPTAEQRGNASSISSLSSASLSLSVICLLSLPLRHLSLSGALSSFLSLQIGAALKHLDATLFNREPF